MYHSTRELITLSVDDDYQSREIFVRWDTKEQRILSCGRAVGADEPLHMGLSSQKSSRGLADGSKRGSGQRPEALRKFFYFSIIFLSFFPTWEKDKIGGINLAFKLWKQIFKVDCQVFVKA